MLREVRESSSLGQRELSRLLGKSSTYVYKVESGVRRIDLIELIAWLKHLEVPVGEFIESFVAASEKPSLNTTTKRSPRRFT